MLIWKVPHPEAAYKALATAYFLGNPTWAAPQEERSPGFHKTRQWVPLPTSETSEALRVVSWPQVYEV